MAHNLIIRNAEPEDADKVSMVLLDFYNINSQEEAIQAFESEIKKGYHYLISEKKGQITGLVTWLTHGLMKHGLFELDRICILKESRGMGLGKVLVESLIEDARLFYQKKNEKIRKLYLLTHEENIKAQLFYEKVGFNYETTLVDHYYENKKEKIYSIFFNE